MIDNFDDFFNEEIEWNEYDDKIFDCLKQKIISNSNLIKKANEIDFEHTKNKVDIDKLVSIINNYRRCRFEYEGKKKIIFYNGDPYITLNIFLQLLIKNDTVLLIYDEYMVGVNEVLLKIFKLVLEDYKASDVLGAVSRITSNLIKKVNKVQEEVIVIGDTAIYQSLDNARFFPYNNYILYSDSHGFDSLKEAIYRYTTEFEYELEVIYEEDINLVIEEVKKSKFDKFILLSNNEDVKNRVTNEIKNKKIYINENPFKDDNGIINFCL